MRFILITLLSLLALVSTVTAKEVSDDRIRHPIAQASAADPSQASAKPLSSAVARQRNAITTDPNDPSAAQPIKRKAARIDPRWSWNKQLYYRFLYLPLYDVFQYTICSYAFWGVLLITLLLERIIPAAPKQKLLSVSFAHDLVWFAYQPLLHALIVGTYVAFVTNMYKSHLSQFTFSMHGVPGWARAVIALLLVDLGYWIQHYFNHKIPFLWKLHAVHHSQKELNFFTDYRYHPLEYIVRHTFITIPFLVLNVDPPVIVAISVFRSWYSRFYHGNIRTNLGPLKYILVTPQSHRVHHSLETQHWDKNFGALFSFWDFLIGTQYKGFEEYPATGIPDKAFPHEQKIEVKSLLLTPWSQMVHRGNDRPTPLTGPIPVKVEPVSAQH
jgi:sterol desaturase/sphingolipid hydroxylase (fatty acid hydroxylase superfamily)